VDEYIAEVGYLRPRKLGVGLPRLVRDLFGSLADHVDVPAMSSPRAADPTTRLLVAL
jgi:hypothetical protein